MRKKSWLSWSSGKDSAWSLYQLLQNPEYDVTGLFTTVNAKYARVAMHSTRLEILYKQAELLNLPLHIVELPEPCSNEIYESKMLQLIEKAQAAKVTHMAFGDLFLEDIRDYRLKALEDSGIEAIFPLWQQPTANLAQIMINNGLKAIITCVDTQQLSEEFIGRAYNAEFLADLPAEIDPCGENGEFHTCVYAGPFFFDELQLLRGKKHWSGPFCFIDLILP